MDSAYKNCILVFQENTSRVQQVNQTGVPVIAVEWNAPGTAGKWGICQKLVSKPRCFRSQLLLPVTPFVSYSIESLKESIWTRVNKPTPFSGVGL